MAMNFWEAQRQAKARTTLYLIIFIVLTFIAAFCAEWAMRLFAYDSYGSPSTPYVGLTFLGITFAVASFNYLNYLQMGGAYVAESIGAKLVDRHTTNSKERQLVNIIEEMAVASSLPVPPIYILEAQEINAFAAGTSPDNAAITVTRGTLNLLNRDELQGVIAHEYSHIYHGDMKIGMRVAAMIMGFFIATYLGLRLLQSASYSRRSDDDRRGGNPMLAIALILLVIGSLSWLFGSILQAMVSRQREFLADASAVQFTRNPQGIADALRKIAQSHISDMPRSGQAFSHLYFNEHQSFWSRLFATHPPLEERIAAIEGGKYTEEFFDTNLPPPPPPKR